MVEPHVERSPEQLRAFVESHQVSVMGYIRENRIDGWNPMFVARVVDPDGTESEIVSEIRGDFRTHESKCAAMRSLGNTFYDQHLLPVMVCAITEAWCSRDPKYTGSGDLKPKDDPNREEVLVFFGSTIGFEHEAMGVIEIDKHPDGYLMPGPKKLHDDGTSPLVQAFWEGMYLAAKKDHQQETN